MYISIVRPDTLTPSELDRYLSEGWFRLGQSLFTTTFLTFNDEVYNAIWIKIDLAEWKPTSKQEGLLKKTANFTVGVKPLVIDDEKKELFLKYRESLDFEPAQSLENVLAQSEGLNKFDSYAVCIYDGRKLIACGILDMGLTNAEGIVSFYDPDYKKYSLGKVLVLHKLFFAKEQGRLTFFPGYVAPGHKKFDYKLDIAPKETSFYDIGMKQWLPYEGFDEAYQPLAYMKQMLLALEAVLHEYGFHEFKYTNYRFYDLGLDVNYDSYGLLQVPVFIHCFSLSSYEDVVVYYDFFRLKFRLVVCQKLFQTANPPSDAFYSQYILKETRLILEETVLAKFALAVSQLVVRRDNTIQQHG